MTDTSPTLPHRRRDCREPRHRQGHVALRACQRRPPVLFDEPASESPLNDVKATIEMGGGSASVIAVDIADAKAFCRAAD